MEPAPPGDGPGRGRRGAQVRAWPARLGATRPLAVRLDPLFGRLWLHLRQGFALEAERRRPFLWLPVAMGAGILLYFAADREPALWAPLAGLMLSGALAFALRLRRYAAMACLAAAAAFTGFAAGVWRTADVAAPMLERARIGKLSGFVESVETRDGGGARLVLLVTDIAGVPAGERPKRVRVNIRAGSVAPGDHILATARLLPPPGPARAGGYDFGRDAFFRGIGAVGSVSGKIALAPPPHPPPTRLTVDATIDRARNALTRRIAEVAGGQGGAVAAALVTGKRGLITEATNNDLRAAGIYHIVSISGLHMVLAAGTIFALVRALLALSQTAALRWPVKKLAALAAMLGATGYCIFSGGDVATERSLIMTLVMLGAILVDRTALSMRNLAIAAMIVLLREPDALLGPSFQMSFGAVAALIAFAERWEGRERTNPPPALPWPLGPIATAALGIVVTTLLATAATAPFGAYHFQTFNPFGLLGNAMALPFVSLFVMPAAVFGVLAYPFGLDWPAWALMGLASDAVLSVAHWVATIDHSTVTVAAFGPAVLGCFALALLWLTLWTTAWRWLAVLPLVFGVAIAGKPERPEILIERDGAGLAVRGPDGRLAIAGKPSRFVLQQWLAADGDARSPDDPSLRAGIACDRLACIARTADRRTVSYARDRLAIVEDCQRADLVVTATPWSGACKAQLIERMTLSRGGATSLYRASKGWSSHAAERSGAERPWSRGKPAPAAPPAAAPRPSADAADGDPDPL
ncbi:ComEC/Rec2 family competence protein [Bosea sp. (in: a-proteobacteria)]|uniref:ComEC/Rec2 family competence protein n=1 Tax=Bosea sp. (in: a-proteobacteria) TaxID=1871050 RepID=UPI00260E46D8|nr:ComEC/Rec2 family competence protein [Bosea sp. (in: a-proteobacteria)]MCO5093262.1 ComEC family competence protein [Bosea sp. (in: a-proteobacteria)]